MKVDINTYHRINIFIYKNHTRFILKLKGVIFKHTKTTENDQIIFLYGREYHVRSTQQISYFYHYPIISYGFSKNQHIKHFSEKRKSFSAPKHFLNSF